MNEYMLFLFPLAMIQWMFIIFWSITYTEFVFEALRFQNTPKYISVMLWIYILFALTVTIFGVIQ